MSGGTMDVSWRLESRVGARNSGLRACNSIDNNITFGTGLETGCLSH